MRRACAHFIEMRSKLIWFNTIHWTFLLKFSSILISFFVTIFFNFFSLLLLLLLIFSFVFFFLYKQIEPSRNLTRVEFCVCKCFVCSKTLVNWKEILYLGLWSISISKSSKRKKNHRAKTPHLRLTKHICWKTHIYLESKANLLAN